MALRLLEMRLPGDRTEAVREALEEVPFVDRWAVRTADHTTWHILAQGEQVEAIVDVLEDNFSLEDDFRIVSFNIEAVIPRPESKADQNGAGDQDGGAEKSEESTNSNNNNNKAPINIEELYEDITHDMELSWTFVTMVAVSAIVAAVGIFRDDFVLVIAAMIIAPLLNPNMALSLATTVADADLAKRAIKVNFLGLTVAIMASFTLGLVLPFEPNPDQASLRTSIGLLDILVAASAGAAGALSFTRVAPGGVVGVMIAVALVPPLVSFGMLAGAGLWTLSVAPLLLATINIICINLAGVVTFFIQRIRPRARWEDERAKSNFRRALLIWLALLSSLIAIGYFAGDYWAVAW